MSFKEINRNLPDMKNLTRVERILLILRRVTFYICLKHKWLRWLFKPLHFGIVCVDFWYYRHVIEPKQ